jgi:O-acetyl-ADP-ribose deacetylase (regulator of RNase III)
MGEAVDPIGILPNIYRKSGKADRLAHSVRTIAFPCISTGAFDYPQREAAEIAISVVQQFTLLYDQVDEVVFCCYSNDDYQIYLDLLQYDP